MAGTRYSKIKLFEFIASAILVFFASFTLLGILGFLPNDLQAALNSQPLLVSLSASYGLSGSSGSAMKDLNSSNLASVDAGVQTASSDALTTAAGFSAGAVVGDQQFAPIEYTSAGTKEYPVKIVIPSIGISAIVSNPKNTSIDVLDNYLTLGAVRYPTSGALNDGSNVYLFGHSSYLRLVHNQAYKTFDNIQDLKKGDQIEVDGPQNAYFYNVVTVSTFKDSNAEVNVGGKDHMLILSTCDLFGEKEDRFIVTASFSGSSPIGQV